MRPNVGRSPARPQRAAGLRIDPLVSVPMPNATHPAAVADEGPADDPLDPCVGSHGFFVWPPNQLIAAGQLAGRELGDQHRARVAQHLDDAGVVVERLLLERRRAPRGLVALDRDDVLRAPRNAVQRPLVLARRDLGVGALRLGAAVVVEERDDVVQQAVVAVQPREVHLGQLERGHLPRAHQLGEMPHRPERHVLEIRRALHRRRRAQTERLLRLVDLDARHDRAEVKRRRDVVRDVDLRASPRSASGSGSRRRPSPCARLR